MANDRCPSCGGAVRAGDPWCTLCWTDLRPKPAPAPVPVPAPAAPVVAAASPVATLDPLTAPLPVLLGEAPAESAAVTWPCVECGSRNDIDLNTCGTCTAPFGGRIARLDDPKAQRRRVLLMALGAVGVFLMLLAAVTFLSTTTKESGGTPPTEQQIDYSTLPQG